MTNDAANLGRLRRLARENQQMGPRLAQLEFREMIRELASDDLFDLSVDLGDKPGAPPLLAPPLEDDPVIRRLAVLDCPLGRIAWLPEPQRLPVIAIHLGDSDPDRMRQPFEDLMHVHHAQPFARIVFLCQNFRVAPFLGRFGFAFEHVGTRAPVDCAPRLRRRFGVVQIRDLASGRLLWRETDA